MDCFRCGADDHLYRDCPQAAEVSATTSEGGRPAWCGQCDKTTRLVDHGDRMSRCRVCWAWPARGTHPGQELPQHKKFGGCHQRIFTWDQMPCGKHQPLSLSYAG